MCEQKTAIVAEHFKRLDPLGCQVGVVTGVLHAWVAQGSVQIARVSCGGTMSTCVIRLSVDQLAIHANLEQPSGSFNLTR